MRDHLAGIPDLRILESEPLARHTRFGIGGPATLFCDAPDQESCVAALKALKDGGLPHVVIGGGTNLMVADAGFDGIVLRFSGKKISQEGTAAFGGSGRCIAGWWWTERVARAERHADHDGHSGLPGRCGLWQRWRVWPIDSGTRGDRACAPMANEVAAFSNADCEFQYRDSWFKSHKEWLILSADFAIRGRRCGELQKARDEIREIRDKKYPPTMKCAGSIFKNLFFAHLPPHVQAEVPPKLVREGKVPSAWFLGAGGRHGHAARRYPSGDLSCQFDL